MNRNVTIGYESFAQMGDPTVVEYREGTPIRFEGLALEVSVKDGVLTVRATDTETLAFTPRSANTVTVRLEPREDFKAR